MASVNKVVLIGNVTRNPELSFTPGGAEVCELGLAMNRRVKRDDEWQEDVTFVDVTVWGNQARAAAKYLSKGRQVYVEGRLRLDQWDDKDTGRKRSKLRVVGESVQFLGSRNQESTQAHEAGARQVEQGDDIPF